MEKNSKINVWDDVKLSESPGKVQFYVNALTKVLKKDYSLPDEKKDAFNQIIHPFNQEISSYSLEELISVLDVLLTQTNEDTVISTKPLMRLTQMTMKTALILNKSKQTR